MRVRLLGTLAVRRGEVDLALGGLKQRAVLALLALDPGRVVSVDRLIGEVWPGEAPARALVTLRAYVSRLRRVLDGTGITIETRAPGWLLRVPAAEVDVVRFERLVDECRRQGGAVRRPEEILGHLGEALALWSGDPLADLTELEFARVEAARLAGLRADALELLLEVRLAVGDDGGVVDAARDFVGAHPFRERAWCALMLGLYRDGRQSEAVAAYAELRRVLHDELGLDPSPQAQELEVRILRQDPGLLLPPSPGLRGSRRGAAATKPAPPPPGSEVPLQGRAEVLERLDAAWRRAGGGAGGLLLVEASAGDGKSALLRTFADRVRADGGRVVEGNGVGGETMPALWPWVIIVRQLLAETPDLAVGQAPSGPAALALATLGGATSPDGATDVRFAQTTLYRGVVDLLLAAHRAAPLAVVLDDLHRVDRDSLTLLTLAVDQLAPAGVLFLVAARREEAGTAVSRLADSVERDRLTRVELTPLRLPDVAALTVRIAGQPVEGSVVAAIAEQTSGNPLFVTELVRLLVAEGRLTEHAARRALPAGVRDVLQRRIARLPREAIDLLVVAALVGPGSLDVDLLAEVTGQTEDAVLDGCEAGLQSGLLVEGGRPGTFGLSHDLVRQTLVTGLSEARLVRLHARIAASLRSRPTVSSELVVETARQLMLAAPAVGAEAAIPYLVSASEDARSRYAHTSAEATLRTALVLAGDVTDPARRQALEVQVGGLLGGLQTLARAALLDRSDYEHASLPQPTDARSAAGWLGLLTNAVTSGRYAWATAAAREVLGRAPSQSAEIAARFVLGCVSYIEGDLDDSAEELAVLDAMIDRGIDIALPGALSHLPETVAGYDALIAHARGDDARAAELLAVGRRRAGGSTPGLLNVVLYECLLAAMQGDRVAAAQHADVAQRLSETVGYPVYAIVTGVVAAWSRDLDGAPGESVDDAYAVHAATGIRSHRVTFLLLRAEVHEAAGDHRGAVELALESRRATARFGEVCASPRLTALAERLAGEAADEVIPVA